MIKLEKCTNENDKKTIKDTIAFIENKIKLIYEDIKKQISYKKTAKKPQTREELLAEILNTDLEMFVKMQNKDYTYVELANKFAKLKRKEKTFAIRGRNSRPYPRRGRGLSRRGSFYQRGSNPLLKVDRRTRKLLIPDISEDDITDLLEHLAVSLSFICIASAFALLLVVCKQISQHWTVVIPLYARNVCKINQSVFVLIIV